MARARRLPRAARRDRAACAAPAAAAPPGRRPRGPSNTRLPVPTNVQRCAAAADQADMAEHCLRCLKPVAERDGYENRVGETLCNGCYHQLWRQKADEP